MRRFFLACLLLAALTLPAAAFSDVPAGHWAAGPIDELAGAGLLAGYPDGSFRPNGAVETLLDDTPPHGLALRAVNRTDGDTVYVTCAAGSDGGEAFYEYAVEHGRLRAVVHGPGEGFAGFTPEEAAAEQARLDAAGVGVDAP